LHRPRIFSGVLISPRDFLSFPFLSVRSRLFFFLFLFWQGAAILKSFVSRYTVGGLRCQFYVRAHYNPLSLPFTARCDSYIYQGQSRSRRPTPQRIPII
jgi:hypothetical protein